MLSPGENFVSIVFINGLLLVKAQCNGAYFQRDAWKHQERRIISSGCRKLHHVLTKADIALKQAGSFHSARSYANIVYPADGAS